MMAPWQPYCGAECDGPVAGRPVICDSASHPDDVMHRNSETGYEWWSFMSYPLAPPVPVPDPSPPAEPLTPDRRWRHRMTRRYWHLLAAASVAFLASGCASSGTTTSPAAASASAASVSASASRASASARANDRAGNAVTACESRKPGGAILVRTTVPGKAASTRRVPGTWTWDTAASSCKSAVQMTVATAPKGTGDCTTVAYASANPGYQVDTTPSAPLKHVAAAAGPACRTAA